MTNTTEETKYGSPITILAHNFENNIYSLEILRFGMLPYAHSYDNIAKKRLEDYKNKIFTIISSSIPLSNIDNKEEHNPLIEGKMYTLVNDILKELRDFDWALINVKFFDQRLELLLKSLLMMLIAYFDFLLSDLLHCYYNKYPKALNDEMQISYGELRRCSELREAVDILVEQKIESLLFKNFTKQLSFFKDDLGIDTAEKFINWEVLNEAYQRRNIIAHNNCVVNKRYLKSIEKMRINVKEGEQLRVSVQYYLNVLTEVVVGGIIITQNCWRKWFSSDLENADSTLTFSINKGLLLREFEIARRLCLYAKNTMTLNKEDKNNLDIMYCYSLKKLNKEKQLKTQLSMLEKHNLSVKCLVGLALLKDDKEAFYQNVKKAVKAGKLNRVELSTEAIYLEYYNDKDYLTRINEIFR